MNIFISWNHHEYRIIATFIICREFMLATSLEGQPGAVDASGRPLSPKVVQGSPVPVPGSLALAEGQSHSEPIPHARPHPERIARKYNYLCMLYEFV